MCVSLTSLFLSLTFSLFFVLSWNESLAVSVEAKNGYGYSPVATGADFVGKTEALNDNWVIYQYIPQTSCAHECLKPGQIGWIRTVLFDSIHINIGSHPLFVGNIFCFVANDHLTIYY
jgi:hypothetical protein